jgi:mono/diheme cytochrome c family protein
LVDAGFSADLGRARKATVSIAGWAVDTLKELPFKIALQDKAVPQGYRDDLVKDDRITLENMVRVTGLHVELEFNYATLAKAYGKAIVFIAMLATGATMLAQNAVPAGNAGNGKKLFLRDGCWECHGYAGQGGRDGARIASTALTNAQFTRYIRRSTGTMPAYIDAILGENEANDIRAYLTSMPAPKPSKDIPLLNDLKGSLK